jgi:siroheme synthase
MLVLAGAKTGPAAQAPRSGRGLRVVGLGLPQILGATGAGLEAIATSGLSFTMDPALPLFQGSPRTAKPIGRTRRALEGIAARAADSARARATSLSIYGHPMVYEPFCHEAVDACARRRVPCRVVAGVSALDTLPSALKLPVGDGRPLQVAASDRRMTAPFDARGHVLLFKACDDLARLEALTARLLETYPARHPVALIRSPSWADRDVVWAPIGRLPQAAERPEVYRSVVIPPLS